MNASNIDIEVAYARPEVQRIIALRVPPGTTAREALRLSGLIEVFPEIDADRCELGIFGQVIPEDDAVLENGDRVEVYRHLARDPKEARRQRAAIGADGDSDTES